MFHIFKKEPFKVVACVNGKCIPISEVKDEVFSKKMMGDGFAIIPTGDTIVSPVTGTIDTIFPTKHAIGIKTNDGISIILHIGIDTVNLNGEGLTALVKAKTKVKAGQPLIQLDMKFLQGKGCDLTTMTIFASGYDKKINLPSFQKDVKAGDILIDR